MDSGTEPGAPDGTARIEPVEVTFETSKGTFVIAVHPDWAPRGAARFLFLVESEYYDDARFHRVVPDFIVQWGLAGDPALTAEWLNLAIADDPVVSSNTRGRIAYAFTEPGTRTTQVYINLVDNVRLDSTGFAPFGEIIRGMDVVDALYDGYGETSGGGVRRGDQSRIITEGNTYLDREFPRLDRILRARVTADPSSQLDLEPGEQHDPDVPHSHGAGRRHDGALGGARPRPARRREGADDRGGQDHGRRGGG